MRLFYPITSKESVDTRLFIMELFSSLSNFLNGRSLKYTHTQRHTESMRVRMITYTRHTNTRSREHRYTHAKKQKTKHAHAHTHFFIEFTPNKAIKRQRHNGLLGLKELENRIFIKEREQQKCTQQDR